MSYYADRDSARVMLSRAEVIETHESEDDLALVSLYGQHGEVLKRVHRVQQFGDAYRPPAGAHGVMMSAGGRREMAMFFGGEEPAKRPRDLGVGERALYNSHGQIIYLHQDRIKVTTALFEIVGPVKITGAMEFIGTITHTGNMSTSGVHTDSNGVHV